MTEAVLKQSMKIDVAIGHTSIRRKAQIKWYNQHMEKQKLK